jgi:ABC-type multidrug transport system ATPase subunit
MTSAGTPMIRLQRFEKRYGKLQAVKPLDLDVGRGETFALLGPNGSGKTTIIRALVGLHRASAGKVLVDGLDIVRSPDAVKQRLSYVPQRVTMPGMLTAREALRLFARLKGVPDRRAGEALELFVLDDSADRLVRDFSGGMLQRLGLAAAFLKRVPLFVLDEPTANLDLLGVDRLRHLLTELRKDAVTIVFSSHVLQSAMQLADRVAVLVDGELAKLEDAPVFRAEVTQRTVIRVILGRTVEGVVAAARDAGAEVSGPNGEQLLFRALPERRLGIMRAIEHAGASIKEVHTEAPDWEDLVRAHYAGEERDP